LKNISEKRQSPKKEQGERKLLEKWRKLKYKRLQLLKETQKERWRILRNK
jgi:hypothetical protein